jgi:hypothetical protein
MRNRDLGIALVLFCAAFAMQCCSGERRSLSMPFFDQRAPGKSGNIHVPAVVYSPLIYLEIINPATGKRLKCFGYLDTGADHCLIRKKLADRLGLKGDGQPAHPLLTGSGEISLQSTMIEYVLNGPEGKAVEGFPVQKAPFFIQDGRLPTDVVLGGIGFLDRFKEVRIAYPKSITLMW